MNFNMISVVISREYTTRVKKKSFLVTTFLVPVLFAALCCLPALMMLFAKDESKLVAVVDRSGIVFPNLESNEAVCYQDCLGSNLDSLKSNMEKEGFDAIVEISPINAENSLSVNAYSIKPLGLSLMENLENKINDCVRDYRIQLFHIDNLKEILEEVKPSIQIKTFTIGEDGQETISNDAVYRVVSLLFGIILFIFVTMFSSSVMQSVMEEKQSKVVEVLLSSVNSVDLMFGKIFGVALVALTQFVLWIVLTGILVSGVFAFVGKDKVMGSTVQSTEIVTAGVTVDLQNATELSKGQEIMQTLAGLDIPMILAYFFIFFIFGYLLYASLFAAIGSAVENAEDSTQLQMPLTVPLMIAYFIALYSWNAPDSSLAVWGSMIPFTSPIVMLARIPFGVPVWQIWLSIALLVITFALMGWMSAKIYRVGILTSGKKATWKDLWKWLRQN